MCISDSNFNARTGLEVKLMGSELNVALQLNSTHKHGAPKGTVLSVKKKKKKGFEKHFTLRVINLKKPQKIHKTNRQLC